MNSRLQANIFLRRLNLCNYCLLNERRADIQNMILGFIKDQLTAVDDSHKNLENWIHIGVANPWCPVNIVCRAWRDYCARRKLQFSQGRFKLRAWAGYIQPYETYYYQERKYNSVTYHQKHDIESGVRSIRFI
jgi:hypothetical protein